MDTQQTMEVLDAAQETAVQHETGPEGELQSEPEHLPGPEESAETQTSPDAPNPDLSSEKSPVEEPKLHEVAESPDSASVNQPKNTQSGETDLKVVAVSAAEPPAEKSPEADKKNELEQDEKRAPEKQTEQQAEPEEKVPVPAPGSLAFAFLEEEQTRASLCASRTLVVLRGLPGSGKSFLAQVILERYPSHCIVCSADDHVKAESTATPEHKTLDEAVAASLNAGTAVVVVDDSNHTQERLALLAELADQYSYTPLFLEPCTEWCRDVPQLAKKTKKGLQESNIQAMKSPLEEMDLPLFYGWFLLHGAQEKLKCMAMDFLKTLDTLEAFKKHLNDFTGEVDKEVDLEQYFQSKGSLHCTTKFCDYGKAEGAKEYAENPVVKKLYGSVFELSLSALVVTPRTVGARVALTEEQLALWPAGADKEGMPEPSSALPLGSRAHVTLGCAENVEPVQTGIDLLEILVLQQEGQQGALQEELEFGSLVYYGQGRWLLNLREPVSVQSCFSSYYSSKKTEEAKKVPEKKKKHKCAIL